MAVLTGKALDDAIRQKAQQGQGVTDKNNQAAYDAYRASIDKEIERKVGTGDALTGNSAYNQSMYHKLKAAKEKAAGEVVVQGSPVASTGNAQSLIDQLNNARLNNTLAALGKSRDAALSNLASEKSAIQPKYYDQRNQVAAGAQQQARNFAEYMAARGGTNSGANAQAELSRNMTTQGNLGTLGRQEAQAYTDIERRTSDLQNAYQSDVASATAGTEADKMQALLNDYYQQQQKDLQIANLMGVYNEQKTLGGKSADLAQSQFDYSKLADQRNFDFQKASTEWNQAFQQGQFNFQKAQTAWENNFKDKSFQQSMNDAAAARGLQWANLNQNQQEFIADQAFREKQFQLSKDQFDWSRNPSNPDNSKNKADFASEYQGLQAGLTSGALQPDVAITEIKNMVASGQINASEAQQMLNLIAPYKAGK